MSHLSSLVLVPHLSRTSLTYLVLNSKNARITELVIKKLWNNPVQLKNAKNTSHLLPSIRFNPV